MRATFFVAICCLVLKSSIAQAPHKLSSSDIYSKIEKLNFLGSALYVAAHPDDENTQMISYLSNEVHARTAYLSLTRGDGGQNMIGPELRELLGVLRTQELLAARKIDGGEQLFARANDFGYSKTPEETFDIWNKDVVLNDVVWAIRTFKPDVIINRFNHRTPGTTHGHHTASAMLSVEAFDLVNDPSIYPDQLKYTSLWQPKRLFMNTSWWFYGGRENFEKADKTNLFKLNTGVYYPHRGLSNNEIADRSRSQHRCQGFGRLTNRGNHDEWLEFLKGEPMPKESTDLFEGINTTWTRVKGGKAIKDILQPLQDNFNFTNPKSHLPDLVKAYQLIQNLEDTHWKTIKTKEILTIIQGCAGLYLEAKSQSHTITKGETTKIAIEAINRSDYPVLLTSIDFEGINTSKDFNLTLINNKKETVQIDTKIPESIDYTNSYWLNKKGTLGMYSVDEQTLIGKPETPKAVSAIFNLNFNGVNIPIKKDVVYRYSEPDKGELYKPFEILPPATSHIENSVIVFANGSKKIPVTVKAHKDNIKGEVQLCYEKGWQVDKETQSFEIKTKGDSQTVVFTLTPPENESEAYISPILKIDGKEYTKDLITIAYDHIPTQSILLPSEAKVVRLNIQKAGENIGYVMGAGDAVPESLEQIGYNVFTIDPEEISTDNLAKYDAVVVGIRAYNVIDALKFKQDKLLEYVKNGGTLIVQYNTAGRWASQFKNIAPFDLNISRERVTDENSEVSIIAKNHSLVNFPNPITESDFNGWVQERGLYFPNQWGIEFTPILSMNDKGETPKHGSLLVAPYGKGHYIYTGLSFFRELPAGVPGAFKLFTNMISVGKDIPDTKPPIKG